MFSLFDNVIGILYTLSEGELMEEQVLREILHEMKGLRQDVGVTNERLDKLERNTGERIDLTNQRLDGLHQSFVVLQQGLADVRYELKGIKDILSERVI